MTFPTGGYSTVGITDFNNLVNLLKYNPFINLLANGSFEIERPTNESAYWFKTGTATVDQSSSKKVYGAYSGLFQPSPSDTMFQEVVNFNDLKGQVISFGAYLWSTESTIKLKIDDGVGSTYSAELTTTSAWTWLEFSHTVDSSATKVSCEITRASGSGTDVYIDGAVLCLGTGVPRSGFIPIDFGVLAKRQGIYSAAPSWTAEAGDQYYNTTTNKSYIYNGSTWNALW